MALVAVVAVGLGASPLFDGLYGTLTWGPLALACAALLLAGVFARTTRLTGAAGVAAVTLLVLGLLCLLSRAWADDDAAALVEGARWTAYAVLLLMLLSLVRTPRRRRVLHGFLTVTVAGVAVYIEAHLLVGEPHGWFVGRRLNEPTGYFNAQAAYALFAFWLILGATENRGSRAARSVSSGFGVAFCVLLLGEVLLTASRAAWPALACAALVVILVFGGRVRRGWMLTFVAAGGAIAATSALDVYKGDPRLVPAASEVHHAALVILLAALGAGLIFALADQGAARFPGRDRLAAPLSACLVGLLVVGAVVGLAAGGLRQLHRQADEFVSLRQVPTTSSRLLSGGGNRYDYWRVAWNAWRREPIGGLGAGNYAQTYFRHRRQSEAIRQPHSLELQALSETGLGGGLLVLVLFLGMALSVRSFVRRRPGGTDAELGLGVGATGVLVSWMAQTSVDWLHLLPGLTGMALAALVLLAPLDGAVATAGRRWKASAVVAVAAVATAVYAVGSVVLAEHHLDRARRDARAGRTTQAQAQLAAALRFESDSADAYYLRAAILASADRYRDARATLLVVARDQPRNYLPLALLGDLALRRGDQAAARAAYAGAIARNPLDRSLRARLARARGQ